MTRPRSMPDITDYVSCEDCIHAKVGRGEICYCSEGIWRNRLLKNIAHVKQFSCADFETVEETA